MPPAWPRNELQVPGLDLDAVLRAVSAEMQRELKPLGPMLEFGLRENVVRKARIRLDGARVRVEDAGDANSLFDMADWAKVDFVEFEAARLTYLDRFERAVQAAFDRHRGGSVTAAPAP